MVAIWFRPLCVNSLAPGKFEWNFRYVFFQGILVIDGWCISCEISLIWMSVDFTDDHSTLVQVMAWCRQATSHYLSQCWPRPLTPYGVIRPQLIVSNWLLIRNRIDVLCTASLLWPSIKIWHIYRNRHPVAFYQYEMSFLSLTVNDCTINFILHTCNLINIYVYITVIDRVVSKSDCLAIWRSDDFIFSS